MKNKKKVKTKKETIAQKALRLLSGVPKSKFIINEFSDGIGKCCVMGHFTRLTTGDPTDYKRDLADYDIALRETSRSFFEKERKEYNSIVDVNNDNTVRGYKHPQIKDRVIACLKDMVKAGY